jgi:hypothetical protein
MFDNSFHAGNALIFPMAVLFTFQQALISNSCFDCDSEHAIESVFRIDRDFKPQDQNFSLFFHEIQCLANVASLSSFIFVKEQTYYSEQQPNSLTISNSHFEANHGVMGIVVYSSDYSFQFDIDYITSVNNTCPVGKQCFSKKIF